MDAKLHQFLTSQGYLHLKTVGKRGLCGIKRMAFTVGVVEGITMVGYAGRWCFDTMTEAVEAIKDLNDVDEPVGEWIKYKGVRGEYGRPKIELN